MADFFKFLTIKLIPNNKTNEKSIIVINEKTTWSSEIKWMLWTYRKYTGMIENIIGVNDESFILSFLKSGWKK